MSRELPDFYLDVLAELGVIGPDRSASAEDSALIEDRYKSVWRILYDKGLLNFDLESAIPAGPLVPLIWITAYHCAGPFDIDGNKLAKLRQQGSLDLLQASDAERILQKQASPELISSTLAVDYF